MDNRKSTLEGPPSGLQDSLIGAKPEPCVHTWLRVHLDMKIGRS